MIRRLEPLDPTFVSVTYMPRRLDARPHPPHGPSMLKETAFAPPHT